MLEVSLECPSLLSLVLRLRQPVVICMLRMPQWYPLRSMQATLQRRRRRSCLGRVGLLPQQIFPAAPALARLQQLGPPQHMAMR